MNWPFFSYLSVSVYWQAANATFVNHNNKKKNTYDWKKRDEKTVYQTKPK